MIDLVILGSTGSIGTQALEVVRENPQLFRVVALAAGGSNLDLLAEQTAEFRPQIIGIGQGDPAKLAELLNGRGITSAECEITVGANEIDSIAGSFPQATVLNAITGGIGLGPTLHALRSGSRVALANKESLVVGGHLVKRAMKYPGQIIPVDSEHSAIAQGLLTGVHEKGLVSPVVTGKSELHQIVLTASGGPFRNMKRSQLRDVGPQQALAHPTWDMGPMVTINSSTLMNKGLELIEAALLFDVTVEQIVPVIHPQSIIHSMVTWQDGSSIPQASNPNMKVPIALGMNWPQHLPSVGVPLRWDEPQSWTFEPVDHQVFPALNLAKKALTASPTHPAVMNAANEVCVHAFLGGNLSWLEIVDTVTKVVEEHQGITDPSYDDIIAVQEWAVIQAEALITSLS